MISTVAPVLALAFIFGAAAIPQFAFGLTCEHHFRSDVTGFKPKSSVSGVLTHPVIVRAMELKLVDDFKPLVDLVPKTLTRAEVSKIRADAPKEEAAKIKYLIEKLFDSWLELQAVSDPKIAKLVLPQMTLNPKSKHYAAFNYTEATWSLLVRKTPEQTKSTLIPLPNAIIIPGARFQEAYYWDSYFAVHALVKTGRAEIVRGQIDNFVFLIKNYGLIPNGNRDYYLSRSQPPLLSRMVRTYLELTEPGELSPEKLAWLKDEVLPYVRSDYENFWMNPATRLDAKTGLNHHYDGLNTKRPERHASDKEEELGKTFRDVRAEAESGKDFTIAFGGETTRYAGVLLNTVLHGVETDLAYFSSVIGNKAQAARYTALARKRATTMNRLLRDPSTGLFFDYHLDRGTRSGVLTADTFMPLAFGLVTHKDAPLLAKNALARLESLGGIMSSEVHSGKQWDAPYGWAPHIMFAVEGLRNVGLNKDAKRIAQNWVGTVDRVHTRLDTMLEKYDMTSGDSPVETGDKYVTQQGFLWTNGVYVWAVTDVLGERLVPVRP